MPASAPPAGKGERGQALPGTLFVVATPIGNLEDITLRALRVLREVTVVAAEDTRRSGNLLRHFGITTPIISLHEHNEHQRTPQVITRLLAGDSVALVSDAGTPGISDPGAILVRSARQAGLRVEPIPGPSAVVAALSASGLATDRFVFAGFPPVRSKDRKRWIEWVVDLPDAPVVCFEAPHRIRKTLAELRTLLVDRPIIVARELTKTHETWSDAGIEPPELGEFVIVIGQSTESKPIDPQWSDTEIVKVFDEISEEARRGRRQTIKAVAERLGLAANAVYAALERAKN